MIFMKNLFLVILFFSSFLSFSQIGEYKILKNPANVRLQPISNKETFIKQIVNNPLVIIMQKNGNFSFVRNPSDRSSTGKFRQYWVHNSRMLDAAVLNKDANIRWNPTIKKEDIIKQYPKGKAIIILKKKKTPDGVFVFFQDPIDGGKRWIHESTLAYSINTNVTIQNTNPVKKVVVQKNVVPNCDYTITYPINDSKDVSTNLIIKWKHGTGSPKGYYFTIASNINGKPEFLKTQDGKLIRQLNIGYVNSYSTPKLKPFTTYNIGILPYNDIGLVFGCNKLFSFTTGSGVIQSNPLKVIENRMINMGLNSKWNVFKRGINNEKIKIRNVKEFLAEVDSYVGTPYSNTGGLTRTSGIDCSGLIYKGLIANGYRGQRLNAQMLAQSGTLIANKSSLKAGDLVAFAKTTSENKLVTHIGIYFGNNRFLHSSSSKGVIYSDINDPYYWGDKFIFGVRF